MSVGSGAVLADDVTHGIGFTKGCTSPTKIGDPYTCSYTVRNNLDDAGDTLTINSLVDTVHTAASGDVSSGEIIGAVKIVAILGATCVASSGDGSVGNPYTGVTSCTLPANSRLNVLGFSYYTVAAADFGLPGHQLRDTASLGWHDLCDDPLATGNSNCNANPPNVGAASLSLIQALLSTTATAIHNAAHQTVTTVAAGTTVHDSVTVSGQAGQPNPTGNVNIDWFLNGTCTGAAAANSGSVGPLDGSGQFDATAFSFQVNNAGARSFLAHYEGDATYLPSTGACEPLQVVDANIQITPTATNHVGDTHTFTAHVNVNDGTGSANAPDGTQISFSIDSGPGGFTSANPCTTAGGTGSCTINLSSAVTGVTTVSAHSTVSVGGISLTRDTNGVPANSGPAVKTWVNAKITITPNATNAVGQPHTFTATLSKDTGTGTFVAAAGETVTITLTNSNGAAASPAGPFTGTTDANGQFAVTFTSASTGTVTGHASSTLSVNGSAAFTVQTDGSAPNSGDAVKRFVNANIQITPANANNPINTNHVLTITVNAVNGTLDAGPHTATASIVSGPGAFVGSPTCTYTGGGASASCTVTISSATTGTTVVSATSNIAVNGVTITRTTGTSVNTSAGGSDNANKTWSAATVTTQVHNPSHQDITNTAVQGGTVVHDQATVGKSAGTPAGSPAPTGSVTFTLYDNGTCNGTVLATSANVALNGSGVAESATFTTPNAAGNFSYSAHYNGDSNYPAANAACEPFSVSSPPTGQITPTQVQCSDILNGTAPTLDGINYTVSGGKIAQSINPGVFFFWTKITTTVPNQVVTVSQSNTSTNNAALFEINQGWDRVYTGDCSSYISGTETGGGTGATFTIKTPGNYILGIKYQTKTIAGTTAPVPANITYNFTTSLGGNTGGAVLLKKQ
jgi:hypothetical protein